MSAVRTGNQPPLPHTARAGFTLIEILLVIALIALAATVVISNFIAFTDMGSESTTEETIRAAIKDARFNAASQREIVSLRFDKESGSLIPSIGEPRGLKAEFTEDGPAEIRFYFVPAAEGLSSFPEAERSNLAAKQIYFAPDRSSSPFVVEIDRGSGSPQRIVYDPFSSIVITQK